ncbi:MAG: DUF3881 family protein, partial [Pseudobutyrivibrio sp.]|nr:DUF3881 family protein [Pseudobutyrivibrio sp.]
MHSFLPAIGFSKLNKEALNKLIEEITLRPDYQESAIDFEGNQFVELRYMIADGIGIVLRGVYNQDDEFVMDYYYPTYFGENISSEGDIEIIKQTDKESYYAVCDETKLGVSLIFYLQNMGEFLRVSSGENHGDSRGVKLAGLSLEGKIILPVINNETEKTKIKKQDRYNLIEQAKDGDEVAIESLTLDDIETYAKISKRAMQDDILTIVLSYFMPYGIENDKFEILGEITECKKIVNHLTMEELYNMTVKTNDILIDVCINAKSLLGEPQVGRRFKGSIWLQGKV